MAELLYYHCHHLSLVHVSVSRTDKLRAAATIKQLQLARGFKYKSYPLNGSCSLWESRLATGSEVMSLSPQNLWHQT